MSSIRALLLSTLASIPLLSQAQQPEVEKLNFSVERGYHSEAFQLIVSTKTPEATIAYTTDGSTPSRTNNKVPTLSIIANPSLLFGEEGIYLDPSKTGRDSELNASLEWISPIDEKTSQVDCGLRIQGSGSRTQSLKKNFRLRFGKEFGPSEYHESLFNEPGPEEFENLILRNPTHDSWTVANHSWRNNARYINDAWAAQTQQLMGHLTPRQRWVHLFLNGQYWGIYALTEKPDEHFVASHLKKKSEDIIVFNGDELQNGKRDRLDETKTWITGSLTNSPVSFQELERRFDVDAFIDYFISNIYAANVDWPDRNFYLIGEESNEPRLRFISWDAEMGFFEKWDGLENFNRENALGFQQLHESKMLFDPFGPGFWYRSLKQHAEFRIRFSDRLYHHLSLGGLLSPTQASLRYRRLLNEVEPLLLLESARWGDAINQESPFRVHNEKWQKLTAPDSWLFTQFFQNRSKDLIEDFQKDGMFPEILPPTPGRPPSRRVEPHQKTIHLLNPNKVGIIVFTTDGQDPREAWTSAIRGRAYREPITLKEGERVKARIYSERNWSALTILPRTSK